MRCPAVQERLADEGVALIRRDAAIREHVAGCEHPIDGLAEAF